MVAPSTLLDWESMASFFPWGLLLIRLFLFSFFSFLSFPGISSSSGFFSLRFLFFSLFFLSMGSLPHHVAVLIFEFLTISFYNFPHNNLHFFIQFPTISFHIFPNSNFFRGGGFALAKASNRSGLSVLVGNLTLFFCHV